MHVHVILECTCTLTLECTCTCTPIEWSIWYHSGKRNQLVKSPAQREGVSPGMTSGNIAVR